MRKLWSHISFCLLASLLVAPAFAQKTAIPTNYKGIKNAFPIKAINDTLDQHFDSATATLYAAPNGGFLSGNSGYNESHKAQFFDASGTKPYTVFGFIYWFGYKDQGSADVDSSFIDLSFSQLDSSTTINNVSYLIPKTVFETKKIFVKDIDTSATYTSGANVWMLNEPKATTFPFAGIMSLKGLHPNDTIALYSSTDGDAPVANKSWERWNNFWHPIQSNWGVKVDFAIFPLVEIPDSMIGIEDVVSAVHMQVFPNPVNEVLQIALDVQQEGMLDILLVDVSGKIILHETKGNAVIGKQTLTLSTSNINSGTYVLSVGINQKHRVSKKIVIAH